MIEVLTPIWQRLLQLSEIRIEDNFFDLGGDSSLAVELFNEIAKVCGRELSPVTIYTAPTIAALAALLEQSAPPRVPALVQLRAGTEGPPVFIAHGLGGSVMEFAQLVRHIRSPHPIYGMQARGTDGVEEPFDRIEDMARYHLDAIRQVQPHGPYFLIGYSLGGLVTFEMAQRLSANGERVGLLALLESYPHPRYLSLEQRFRLFIKLTKMRLSGNGNGKARKQPEIGIWFTPAMQRVRKGAQLALKHYRPSFYPGKMKFVGAQISSTFPDDPTAVWSRLADEFDFEAVPGDHLGIITTHCESLGSVLSHYLDELSGSDLLGHRR
jgi:surfactin synthase thioesterase subunit/acyl carrier protein